MKPSVCLVSSALLLASAVSPLLAAPRLLVQNGHAGSVTAMIVTPDGRHLVTGGADNKFKIWDTATARVMATQDLPRGPAAGHGVATLSVSANSRMLAVATWHDVTVWDISNPVQPARVLEMDRKMLGQTDDASDNDALTARLADKDQLVTAADSAVRVWKLAGGHAELLHKTTVSRSDGDGVVANRAGTLIAAGDGNTLQIVDLQSGQVIKASDSEQVYSASSDDTGPGVAQPLAFGPDDSVAASGGHVRVWDYRAHTLRFRAGANAKFVACSPDGSTIAAVTYEGQVDLYHAADGKQEAEFKPVSDKARALAFTPDSHRIVVGYDDGTARSFDLQGRLVTAFRSHSVPFRALSFLGTKHTLVTSTGHGATLWNMDTGRIRMTIPLASPGQGALATSRDGRRLALGDDQGLVQVIDTATGTVLKKLSPPGRVFHLEVTSLAFSLDGTRLAAGNSSGYITVFELPSGDILKTFDKLDDFGVMALAFAPDNRTLVSGHYGEVRQADIPTRNVYLRRQVPEHYKWVNGLVVSPDGKQVTAAIDGGFLYTWATEKETPPVVVRLPEEGACALTGSPTGRQVLACVGNGDVYAWDTRSQKVTRLVKAAFVGTGAATFTPDGRYVVTGGDDGVLRFWSATQQEQSAPVAQAVELDGGKDWIATDGQGRFDGTSGGQRLMEWRIGDRIYALDQFFNSYFTPGLLSHLVHPTAQSRSMTLPIKDISHLPPPPRVSIDAPESGDRVATAEVVVKTTLTDQGGGVSRPALYLNGHRLPEACRTGTTFKVRLAPGQNHLHLSAFNRDGSIESRGDDVDVTCQSAAARPVLYVLAVGIDHYQAGMKLNYARHDAQSMASFFKPGLFSAVKPVVLVDEKASKSAILAQLHRLAKETSPGDAVVIYLAGHGTLVGDLFYYLPWDAKKSSQEALTQSGLSSVELGEALTDIPATKQIVVLDACHSGAAAGSLGRMLATRDLESGETRAVQRLSRASGSFLIAASKDDQTAKEVPQLKHGVLTYAILHGLGDGGPPAAPANGEGQVTVNGLLRYLDDEVPRLAQKYQAGDGQDIVQATTGQDFPIVLIRP